MRRASRVDRNHAEIVDALERAGCSVQSMAAVANGCPDLLVGTRERMYLFEVKDRLGRLRASQIEWAAWWRGPKPQVVRSPDEALRACALVDR